MTDECCEDSCCESGKDCGCGSKCSCGGENCGCDEGMSKSAMIMGLANEAWGELMKEKMKASYEKAMGDKMNKTAAIGVEMCMAFWGNKMKEGAAIAEFEEKLRKAMM